MIREFKTYRWGRGDSPVKEDDHCMDELRYYIMSRPENKKPEPKPNFVQLEKERRLRALRYKR